MKRLPDWTKEEFGILLQNNSLLNEGFTTLLPSRTIDAIQIVRSGIHEFHKKGDSTLLSRMMKESLTKSGIVLSCPICGERISVRAGEGV
jgi:hypothetical protein